MKQFRFRSFANTVWIGCCLLLQGCSWFQSQKEKAAGESESAAVGSVEADALDVQPIQPAPSPVRYEPKRPVSIEPMPMQPMVSEVRPFQNNVYHVQQGDTLSSISEKFNVRLVALLRANNLGLHEKIYVGQEIVIPSTGNPWALHAAPRGKQSKAKGGTTYRVKPGDTLASIARKFHVSVNRLAKANRLKNKNRLSVGQRLTIPGGVSHKGGDKGGNAPGTYRVKRGDTLFSIAKRHKMTVSSLRQRNHLVGDRIRVGQVLVVTKGNAGASVKKQTEAASASSFETQAAESTTTAVSVPESETSAQSSDAPLSMTPEDQAWLEEGTLPVVPLEEVSR